MWDNTVIEKTVTHISPDEYAAYLARVSGLELYLSALALHIPESAARSNTLSWVINT